jgi:hypothetical protein
MDGAGTAGCHADAHGARELRMGRGHEGRELFVTRLNESRAVVVSPETGNQSIYSVARVSIYSVDIPTLHALHDIFANAGRHNSIPLTEMTRSSQ